MLFPLPYLSPLVTSLNFYCLAINSRICWERKEPTIISGRHLIPLLRGPQQWIGQIGPLSLISNFLDLPDEKQGLSTDTKKKLTEGLPSWSVSSSSSSHPELRSQGVCTGLRANSLLGGGVGDGCCKSVVLLVSLWGIFTDHLSGLSLSSHLLYMFHAHWLTKGCLAPMRSAARLCLVIGGVSFWIRVVHSEALGKHQTQRGKKLRWELYQTTSALNHLSD